MRARPLLLAGAIAAGAGLATWIAVERLARGGPASPPDAVEPRAAAEPAARLEGTVRLPDGGPAAGARLVAASEGRGAAGEAAADGRFALEVPAGSWRLHASLGERAGAGGPFALAAGSTERVELRLGPAAEIRGEAVHAASGRPAAGARVAAFAHETREALARTVADAEGRFRLAGLPPGPIDVRASAEGASDALAVGISLEPGASFPLRLALEATGSAAGIVTGADGRPLAGVSVRAVPRGEGVRPDEAREVRTDRDGAWRIDGLGSGPADVAACREGTIAGASRAIRVVPGRVARADLALPEPGILSGRVRRGGKPPPPGTAVVATPLRPATRAPERARAAVDAEGSYRLALPAGEYRVVAAPPGAPGPDLRARPGFARVEPRRTSRLELEAPLAAAGQGVQILVTEPGGAPSSGAAVTLGRPGDAAVAFAASADEDGRVTIERGLGVAGRRVVIRARNGGRTGTATLVFPPQGVVPVALAPAAAVKGVVRGRGRPVDLFTVEAATEPEPGGWRALDAHRFAGDRFELTDLPAGRLRITVRARDGRRGEASLTLAAGEVRSLEIVLAR